jgi:hypothetical protein
MLQIAIIMVDRINAGGNEKHAPGILFSDVI